MGSASACPAAMPGPTVKLPSSLRDTVHTAAPPIFHGSDIISLTVPVAPLLTALGAKIKGRPSMAALC